MGEDMHLWNKMPTQSNLRDTKHHPTSIQSNVRKSSQDCCDPYKKKEVALNRT